MKKYLKSLLVLSAIAGAMAFSGCSIDGNGVPGTTTTNYMGIYKKTKKDFTPPGSTTFELGSRELRPREVVSGSQKTFLWGLVTYTDY